MSAGGPYVKQRRLRRAALRRFLFEMPKADSTQARCSESAAHRHVIAALKAVTDCSDPWRSERSAQSQALTRQQQRAGLPRRRPLETRSTADCPTAACWRTNWQVSGGRLLPARWPQPGRGPKSCSTRNRQDGSATTNAAARGLPALGHHRQAPRGEQVGQMPRCNSGPRRRRAPLASDRQV